MSKDFLRRSFKLYISYEEKETLVSALAGELSLDNEDLLDLLSNYQCRRLISKDNLVQTVDELAHQEIIQKPRYIIDCFSSVLHLLKVYSAFKSAKNLVEMYDHEKPTSRKVFPGGACPLTPLGHLWLCYSIVVSQISDPVTPL